jgi:prepilin-type N-terminal cleavage/methylation domain-containing protein
MNITIMPKTQKGDTIVEVMLAMAVIGLVLGAAFGIANRGVITGRNAQERSEALKIAESQLELMKANADDPQVQPTNPAFNVTGFCMVPSGTPVLDSAASPANCRNQDGQGGPGFYSIKIDKPTALAGSSYVITVTWERLGASTADPQDSVSLYYKLGAL